MSNHSTDPETRDYRIQILATLAVILVAGGAIVGIRLIMNEPQSTDPTPFPEGFCRVQTADERDVFNEPDNPDERVGAIEQGVYRIVAISENSWVSVDWQESGIGTTPEEIPLLDWIELQEGVDVILGDCDDAPRLYIDPTP